MTLTIDKTTKPTELDVLMEAAGALRAYEEAQQALKAAEADLRRLCRAYDLAAGVWGFQHHHLRRACEARGLMK